MPSLPCASTPVSLASLTLLAALPIGALRADNLAAMERLRQDVSFLADDRLEGRDVGTAGLGEAAQHIRERFRALGLKSGVADGSYFQVFKVKTGSAVSPETKLELFDSAGNALPLERGRDYQAIAFGGDGDFDAPIVFVGYGIVSEDPAHDDYAGVDVEGKVVLMIRREPQLDKEDSPFAGTKLSKHAELATKVRHAWKRKAAGILLVNDPATVAKEGKDELMASDFLPIASAAGVPLAHISIEAANKLLANSNLGTIEDLARRIDDNLAPISSAVPTVKAKGRLDFHRMEVDTPNVVGVLEGEGPHANETIIIGAHFDHVGMGGINSRNPTLKAIHNGADDNASGTSALLELAKRFVERPTKPARRLVFIAFSGEERGLLGSRHYVRKDPLFPLEDTVMMFNFDMVGRLRDGKLILYGTKSAEGIEPVVTAIDEAAEDLTVRQIPLGVAASDHITFYQNKIPALHFFTGMHSEYHLPTDDVDKVNLEGMSEICDFSEKLIDHYIDAPSRPVYVKVEEKDPHAGVQLPTGTSRVYLGTSPDYGDELEGVLLDGVQPNSPADRAGLKAGDIIVEFDTQPIKTVQQYTSALYSHKPNDKVSIVVLRGPNKERVTLEAVLGERGSPASE